MNRKRAATLGVIFATGLGCYLANVQAFVRMSGIPPWAQGTNATFSLNLGSAGRTLTDGNTSWDTAALPAFSAWSSVMARLQINGATSPGAVVSFGNGANEITYSNSAFGSAWDKYTLAVTRVRTNGSNIVESDIVFNPNQSWDSYRGNLHYRSSDGFAIGDIRRVLEHELGHAIGLDHPDQHGQTVDAIMNSVTSDRDALAADDIAGGQSMYGAASGTGTPTPTPTPSTTATPTATPIPTPTPGSTPMISIVAAPTSIMEGGTATFTISASVASDVPLTVGYSMSGNAALTVEYILDGTFGQVVIPAGATSAVVTLVAPSNPKRRGSETATMNLNLGALYGVASTSGASVTIRNVRRVAAFAEILPTNEPSGSGGGLREPAADQDVANQ